MDRDREHMWGFAFVNRYIDIRIKIPEPANDDDDDEDAFDISAVLATTPIKYERFAMLS